MNDSGLLIQSIIKNPMPIGIGIINFYTVIIVVCAVQSFLFLPSILVLNKKVNYRSFVLFANYIIIVAIYKFVLIVDMMGRYETIIYNDEITFSLIGIVASFIGLVAFAEITNKPMPAKGSSSVSIFSKLAGKYKSIIDKINRSMRAQFIDKINTIMSDSVLLGMSVFVLSISVFVIALFIKNYLI